MKKYLIKQFRSIIPPKNLRKQKFMRHSKHRQSIRQYGHFQYKTKPKSSRFNRWQDYRRTVNKFN